MAGGRRRAFDKDEALQQAMLVFWDKGYSGASLSDLIQAMGINKPSMYAAFGNKQQLYISAVNKYVEDYSSDHLDNLAGSALTLSDKLRKHLHDIVQTVANPNNPLGCLIASSTCSIGSNSLPEDATQLILDINQASKTAFIRFFTAEQARGVISADESPEELAGYLLTIQFGLAVAARNGTAIEPLNKMVERFIASFGEE